MCVCVCARVCVSFRSIFNAAKIDRSESRSCACPRDQDVFEFFNRSRLQLLFSLKIKISIFFVSGSIAVLMKDRFGSIDGA